MRAPATFASDLHYRVERSARIESGPGGRWPPPGRPL